MISDYIYGHMNDCSTARRHPGLRDSKPHSQIPLSLLLPTSTQKTRLIKACQELDKSQEVDTQALPSDNSPGTKSSHPNLFPPSEVAGQRRETPLRGCLGVSLSSGRNELLLTQAPPNVPQDSRLLRGFLVSPEKVNAAGLGWGPNRIQIPGVMGLSGGH